MPFAPGEYKYAPLEGMPERSGSGHHNANRTTFRSNKVIYWWSDNCYLIFLYFCCIVLRASLEIDAPRNYEKL